VSSILYSKHSGIGRLTLNRPKVRNALDSAAWRALGRAVDRIAADASVRCVIVSGSGRGFSAGTDVGELACATADEARTLARLENDVLCRVEDLLVPTIAAVHGFALGGGCEIALACDLRICDDDVVFGQPEIDLGWIPAAGATFRLPRIVGDAVAREMIYTGRKVSAGEAFKFGLVNRVAKPGDLDAEVRWLAKQIAAKDPEAIRAAKAAMSRSADREEAIGREAEALARLGTSASAQARIEAFLGR